MQAFFGVIGLYISGSGFEDVIFQLGLCQPGSMTALIKGKHYNQAWLIHESFAEALSRMFIEKYISTDVIENINTELVNPNDLLQDPGNKAFLQSYIKAMRNGLDGDFGKTVQFWMNYILLVDTLHDFHFAIQTNNFEERLKCWRYMLPSFFFFDRTHYSRYGSYYLKSMEYTEDTHPGAKEELKRIGICVRKNKTGIGQAIDLAGEQGYMRDAKTSGGITHFQTKASTVLKWVRSRPFQAKFTEALKEISNLEKTSDNHRKCLRPSEILKSNKIVLQIITCLKTPENISDSLMNIDTIGRNYFKEFELRMLSNQENAFFDPI